MARIIGRLGRNLASSARVALIGPQILAFLPALALGAYWFGPTGVLLLVAVLIPAIFGLMGLVNPKKQAEDPIWDAPAATLLGTPAGIEVALDQSLTKCAWPDVQAAALVAQLDNFRDERERHGPNFTDEALSVLVDRLRATLLEGDSVCKTEEGRFYIALGPTPRLGLEPMIQIANRAQRALSQTIKIDNRTCCFSASVGFCLDLPPTAKGASYLANAEAALQEAQANGGGTIRAFTTPSSRKVRRAGLADEVAHALEAGQIRPWFQPQISTDTGEISGMEALARWEHPERGVILPGAFLPALSAAGLSPRLGEVILSNSLIAMNAWEQAGLRIPTVSVNFSHDELADPTLPDRLRWELDRFQLTPNRLVVEILETVISRSDDDAVTRNASALQNLGCGIDLDDFGTGHASIANIRRFSVSRIKIDRSFVSAVDTDREQQALLSAILEMAERLEISTLAEGVETPAEHALLAQLGCGFVQGYLISRPLPFSETLAWMREYNSALGPLPRISREAG